MSFFCGNAGVGRGEGVQESPRSRLVRSTSVRTILRSLWLRTYLLSGLEIAERVRAVRAIQSSAQHLKIKLKSKLRQVGPGPRAARALSTN